MREYFFADRSQKSGKTARRFVRRADALNFVRREAANAITLAELRHWASRRHHAELSDRRLFEYAASCLLTEQLYARSLRDTDKSEQAKAKSGSTSNAGLAPAQTQRLGRTQRNWSERNKEPELRVRAREAPKVQAAKSPDTDKQVAVLLAAAESGAPFCEECERRRQQEALSQ